MIVSQLRRGTWQVAGSYSSFLWGSSPVLSTEYAHLPYLYSNSISSNFQHSISLFPCISPTDFSPGLSVSFQVRFLLALFLTSILIPISRLFSSTYFVVYLLSNDSNFCLVVKHRAFSFSFTQCSQVHADH